MRKDLLDRLTSIAGKCRFSMIELESARRIRGWNEFDPEDPDQMFHHSLMFDFSEFQQLQKMWSEKRIPSEEPYKHALVVQLCVGLCAAKVGLQKEYRVLYFEFLERLLDKTVVLPISIALQLWVYYSQNKVFEYYQVSGSALCMSIAKVLGLENNEWEVAGKYARHACSFCFNNGSRIKTGRYYSLADKYIEILKYVLKAGILNDDILTAGEELLSKRNYLVFENCLEGKVIEYRELLRPTRFHFQAFEFIRPVSPITYKDIEYLISGSGEEVIRLIWKHISSSSFECHLYKHNNTCDRGPCSEMYCTRLIRESDLQNWFSKYFNIGTYQDRFMCIKILVDQGFLIEGSCRWGDILRGFWGGQGAGDDDDCRETTYAPSFRL
jgi:hypothetical protein